MESATLTAFNHGNRRIVAGLFWQPLERPRNYMKEAREIGKEHDMDIVTIRRTETVIQAGFISKKLGAVKGMYSLASILAEKLGTKENNFTFIAVVRLPDGRFAMVAVSGNAILPESDRIEDLETVRRQVQKFYSLLDKPDIKIYAPPELGDYGGEELVLDAVLQNVHRRHQLRPLFFGMSTKEVAVAGIVILGVCVALGVFLQWRHSVAEKERLAAIAAAAERARLQRESGKKATPLALVHPWAQAPKPSSFIQVCQPAIDTLPLSVAAWTFQAAKCTLSGMEAVYKRQSDSHATIEDFVAEAAERWPGKVIQYAEDDTAHVRVPLQFRAGGDDELMPVATIRNAVISHFQRLLVVPHVKQQPSVAKPLPGQKDAGAIPDWTTLTFEPESEIAADQLLVGLPADGVRVNEVEVSLRDIQLTWSLKGEIYAK